MMSLSGVPLTWRERDDKPDEPWDVDGGSWPFVFIGGPTATSNPEPVADFVDFVALGDGGKGVDASGETGGATTQIVVDFVLGGGDVSRLHAPVVGDVGEKATVGARRERDGVANVVEIDERERGVGFVVELAR